MTDSYDGPSEPHRCRGSFLVWQDAPKPNATDGRRNGRMGVAYEYPYGYEVQFPGHKPLFVMSLKTKGIERC